MNSPPVCVNQTIIINPPADVNQTVSINPLATLVIDPANKRKVSLFDQAFRERFTDVNKSNSFELEKTKDKKHKRLRRSSSSAAQPQNNIEKPPLTIFSSISPKILQRALLESLHTKQALKLSQLKKMALQDDSQKSFEKIKDSIRDSKFNPFSSDLEYYISEISNPLDRLEFTIILDDYRNFYQEHAGNSPRIIRSERIFRKAHDEIISGLEFLINERLSKITIEEIKAYMQYADESHRAKKEWPNIHSVYQIGEEIHNFFRYYILFTENTRNTKNIEEFDIKQFDLNQTECFYRLKVIVNLLKRILEKNNFFLYMYLSKVMGHPSVDRLKPISEKFKELPEYQKFLEQIATDTSLDYNHRNCQKLMSGKKSMTPFIGPYLSILAKFRRQIKKQKKENSLLMTLQLDQLLRNPKKYVEKLDGQSKKIETKINKSKKRNTKGKLLLISKSVSEPQDANQLASLQKQSDDLKEKLLVATKIANFLYTTEGKDMKAKDIINSQKNLLLEYKRSKKKSMSILLGWIKMANDKYKNAPLVISYLKWMKEIPEWNDIHDDENEYYELSYALHPINEATESQNKGWSSVIFPFNSYKELSLTERIEKERRKLKKIKKIKNVIGGSGFSG